MTQNTKTQTAQEEQEEYLSRAQHPQTGGHRPLTASQLNQAIMKGREEKEVIYKHKTAKTECRILKQENYLGMEGYRVEITKSSRREDLGRQLFLKEENFNNWEVKAQ